MRASKKTLSLPPGLQNRRSRSRPSVNRTKPVPVISRSIEHDVATVACRQGHGEPGRHLATVLPNCCGWGPGTGSGGWTGPARPSCVGLRLALQLIHEAPAAPPQLRHRRTLNQQIFELANLPFLAVVTWRSTNCSRVARSPIREISRWPLRQDPPHAGHFPGPAPGSRLSHRVRSFSKRQHASHRHDSRERAFWRPAQTFFIAGCRYRPTDLFHHLHVARLTAAAAEELLKLASDIFNPESGQILVLADAEHFAVELLDGVKSADEIRSSGTDGESARPACQVSGNSRQSCSSRGVQAMRTAKVGAGTPQDSTAPGFVLTNTCSGKGNDREEYRFNAFLATLTETRSRNWLENSPATACGGVLQCSPVAGLESCRDLQPQHSLCPDDDGATRPSGDRSVSQTACPARARERRCKVTWPQPTSAVWRGT